MFYDLIYGIVKKHNYTDMHYHHFFSTILFSLPMFAGIYGSEINDVVSQAELTSPMVCISEIIEAHEGNSRKHVISQILFMTCFFFVRIVWSSWALRSM